MGRTKGELSRLQEEEALLGQNLLSGRVQLDSITKSLRATQDELNQVRPLLHPATGPILKDGPTATPLTDSWQLSAALLTKSQYKHLIHEFRMCEHCYFR